MTPGPELRAVAAALGERAVLSRPLGPLTTYGVGGPAALYVEIETASELEEVRAALRDAAASGALGERSVFVIGRGSNLLVSDGGFDGIVVHLGAGFAGLELPDGDEGDGDGDGAGRSCAPVPRWRSPSWRGGWPMRDGPACRGPSACPGPSAARCA